jgi:hypothetical protein
VLIGKLVSSEGNGIDEFRELSLEGGAYGWGWRRVDLQGQEGVAQRGWAQQGQKGG